MSEIRDNDSRRSPNSDRQSTNPEKVSDSIGVLIQRGGVAHFRDVFFTIAFPDKEGRGLTRKQRLMYATGLLTFATIVGCLGWIAVQRFNQNLAEEKLILNRSVGEIADPKLLPIARRIILQADKSFENREHEKAASYYRKVIDYSMSLYQHETKQTELTLLPTCSGNQSKYLESHEIFCESQDKLVSLIEAIYFPTLIEQLKNDKIGKFLGFRGKDLKGIYSEGALRTTYGILVREDGVWADEGNNDGLVSGTREALKLPCSLLNSIEKLWHEHAGSSCGWFDSQTKSVSHSPGCSRLDGFTLTDSIFLGDYQAAMNRLNQCGLIPSDAIRNY